VQKAVPDVTVQPARHRGIDRHDRRQAPDAGDWRGPGRFDGMD
jgi:hypothetical protein